MAVFEEEATKILLKLLDRKAEQAEKEIKEKGTLSEEHAIPLILKILFNHVIHLDKEVTTIKEEIKEIKHEIKYNLATKADIEKLKTDINELKNNLFVWLSIGFGIIAVLVSLFGFLK